jgi:hypothetical protein
MTHASPNNQHYRLWTLVFVGQGDGRHLRDIDGARHNDVAGMEVPFAQVVGTFASCPPARKQLAKSQDAAGKPRARALRIARWGRGFHDMGHRGVVGVATNQDASGLDVTSVAAYSIH